jgi:hypothetical protein
MVKAMGRQRRGSKTGGVEPATISLAVLAAIAGIAGYGSTRGELSDSDKEKVEAAVRVRLEAERRKNPRSAPCPDFKPEREKLLAKLAEYESSELRFRLATPDQIVKVVETVKEKLGVKMSGGEPEGEKEAVKENEEIQNSSESTSVVTSEPVAPGENVTEPKATVETDGEPPAAVEPEGQKEAVKEIEEIQNSPERTSVVPSEPVAPGENVTEPKATVETDGEPPAAVEPEGQKEAVKENEEIQNSSESTSVVTSEPVAPGETVTEPKATVEPVPNKPTADIPMTAELLPEPDLVKAGVILDSIPKALVRPRLITVLIKLESATREPLDTLRKYFDEAFAKLEPGSKTPLKDALRKMRERANRFFPKKVTPDATAVEPVVPAVVPTAVEPAVNETDFTNRAVRVAKMKKGTLRGGMRKKKLRTRRRDKQNVRRSSGGKNRSNRTDTYSSRRTEVDARGDELGL